MAVSLGRRDSTAIAARTSTYWNGVQQIENRNHCGSNYTNRNHGSHTLLHKVLRPDCLLCPPESQAGARRITEGRAQRANISPVPGGRL